MNSLVVTVARAGRPAAPLAALLLAACGSGAPGQRPAEYLDEATGATITRAVAPLTLYSEDPARAANARDYLCVAPLLVNRSGTQSAWLWLGPWSTIDRGVTGGDAQRIGFTDVTLLLDGEPMDLDVSQQVGAVPGIGQLPYASPVGTGTGIILPLTGSQLARLGRAAEVRLYTLAAGGEALLWQPWDPHDGGAIFPELAAAAAVDK